MVTSILCQPNKLVSSALAQVETVACFNVELFVKLINRRLGNPCPLILRQDPTVSPELEMMMMMMMMMMMTIAVWLTVLWGCEILYYINYISM